MIDRNAKLLHDVKFKPSYKAVTDGEKWYIEATIQGGPTHRLENFSFHEQINAERVVSTLNDDARAHNIRMTLED